MARAAQPFLLRPGLFLRAPRWCRLASGFVVTPLEIDGLGRRRLCAHSAAHVRSVGRFQLPTEACLVRITQLLEGLESESGRPAARRSAAKPSSDDLVGSARVMHVLRESGLGAALQAYTDAPAGSVLLSPADLRFLTIHLTLPTHGSLPSASDVAICATIAREQLAAHLPQPDHVSLALFPLQTAGILVLQALGSRTAIPDRREDMEALLDLMQRGRIGLPAHGKGQGAREMIDELRNAMKRRDLRAIIHACFRSSSHAAAIDALSELRDLSEADLALAVEALASLNVEARPFMSAEHFARVLDLHVKRKLPVTSHLFVAYFYGLANALKIARQPEERADIETVSRGVYNAGRAAERMLRAQTHLRLDSHRPEVAAIPGYAALLRLYLSMGPCAVRAVRRCWRIVRFHRHTAARILRVPLPLDATCEMWEDFLTMRREPTRAEWNAFSRALGAGGSYAALVRAVVDCVGDDLASAHTSSDQERCVEKVLAHTSLPEVRARKILSYISRSQMRVPFLIPRKSDVEPRPVESVAKC